MTRHELDARALREWAAMTPEDHCSVNGALLAATQNVDEYSREANALRVTAGFLNLMRWRRIDSAPKDGTQILGWDGASMYVVRWCDHPPGRGSAQPRSSM
jgi:hypothetical protein